MEAEYYNDGVIESDPEKRGGEPVFPGTRVPVSYLFGSLCEGYDMKRWFESWDTPTAAQWVNVLNTGEKTLLKNRPDAVFSGTDIPVSRLFEFFRRGFSYHDFLKEHPAVRDDEPVLVLKGAEDALFKSLPLELFSCDDREGYVYIPRYEDTNIFLWYLPDQWEQLRATAKDPERLPETFEEWHGKTENLFFRLEGEGSKVAKVIVKVPALLEWLKREGKDNTHANREQYAIALYEQMLEKRGAKR